MIFFLIFAMVLISLYVLSYASSGAWVIFLSMLIFMPLFYVFIGEVNFKDKVKLLDLRIWRQRMAQEKIKQSHLQYLLDAWKDNKRKHPQQLFEDSYTPLQAAISRMILSRTSLPQVVLYDFKSTLDFGGLTRDCFWVCTDPETQRGVIYQLEWKMSFWKKDTEQEPSKNQKELKIKNEAESKIRYLFYITLNTQLLDYFEAYNPEIVEDNSYLNSSFWNKNKTSPDPKDTSFNLAKFLQAKDEMKFFEQWQDIILADWLQTRADQQAQEVGEKAWQHVAPIREDFIIPAEDEFVAALMRRENCTFIRSLVLRD